MVDETTVPPQKTPPKRQLVQMLAAEAAVALVAPIVIGFVIASLAAAGIITMVLAIALLCLAWLVAVGGTFVLPWEMPPRHRWAFAGVLALILGGIGYYETIHYEKPPTAKEIAEEVGRMIATAPSLKTPASSPPSEAPLDQSLSDHLQSKMTRIIHVCRAPSDDKPNPTPDEIAKLNKQYSDLVSGTFELDVEAKGIPNGYSYSFTSRAPNTRFPGFVSGVTFELRRYKEDIYVVTIPSLPEPISKLFSILSFEIPPNDPGIKPLTSIVERLLGVSAGSCRMI